MSEPAFGRQAVYLDERDTHPASDRAARDPKPTMAELKAIGVNYIGPPLWMLVTAEYRPHRALRLCQGSTQGRTPDVRLEPERSGPLKAGGGSVLSSSRTHDVGRGDHRAGRRLAKEVGVAGIFSDGRHRHLLHQLQGLD
jgi:glycerophosphoryl diester phosphodiesterase